MILINGRFLSQRITGIQRFAYEICCALQQIGVEFMILAPENIDDSYDIRSLPIQFIGGKGSHFWEQVTLPRYMNKHYNGQILLSLSGLSPICYAHNIMTIHDISYLLRPRAYSWLYSVYYRIMTPWAAKQAKRVLTVSEFSKSEIMKYLGLKDSKIIVVYNAVRQSDILSRIEGKNFLLAVGSLMPRKNIKRLLEAYCSLENPDFKLYIVGGTATSFANTDLNTYTQNRGIQLLGYVSTNELMHLYRNATAYINPSLYEGFGIPLIEAMTNECAVVVSDIPVFHEVCGEAALYFNPLDITDIQSKMIGVMHDASLREQLIQKGKKQAKKYSWERSARTIKRVIEEL